MTKLRQLLILTLILCCLSGCTQQTLQNRTQPVTSISPPSFPADPSTDPPDHWTHEASLVHLLEDTNHSGEYLTGTEEATPGTAMELWQIPQPSQSRIGETVSLILAREQQEIPFYYSYNRSGEERLAVFIHAKIPMLVVFETQLGGIQELYRCISSETVFQGKILSMTNIDNLESQVYARNLFGSDDVAEDEHLTADTSLVEGECVGIVGTDEGGTVLSIVKGGMYESASEGLKQQIDWMKKILMRYSLEDVALIQ